MDINGASSAASSSRHTIDSPVHSASTYSRGYTSPIPTPVPAPHLGWGMMAEDDNVERMGSGPGPMGGGNNEWRYEMRREAQQIIPGLYLGPFQSSTNLNKMKMMGITHVLCIRDRKESSLIYPRFPTEFRYMTLDISDNSDQNLISIFPKCVDFIEESMNMNGVVLAHCNGGIALSPAIVVGYLMWKFSWTADHALAYVQSKRYCVSTMSFQNQFKEYEPIQMAQKMVQQVGFGARTGSAHKRQVEDEDIDDDDDDDRRRKQPMREPIREITME
ncbi:uncharacterized protein I303_104406 [Kwoniella dejecticola CBS 10117]|uniref:Serine/threonine/tyrosine-interacting protein n=1 Tax=Kwoniella dejecticola CBS 10117 TaxID=1296121 RepID=A0A1A6A5E8_9TREE|nr:serine/threonine/tyrosine-interacting protein [Kwoniella dejecticola CBS 10117]OBR85282.1 serine/threonine/tyrosine-interacting protein [Kwoniella dejecticola CBS 10117]